MPITGKVNVTGTLEDRSSQHKGWINPKSLEGQLKITLLKGEIRRLGLIRNVLLMKLALGFLFVPGLREVLLLDEAVQLARTKGRMIKLTTVPYERLEENFSIR
jgi:hypothetical protein